MLRLRVSRSVVSLEGPNQRIESTRAVVALTVEGGRVGIVAVGEREEEIEARLSTAASGSGLAGRIVAAAEARGVGMKPVDYHFLHVGDDPWWDQKWQNAYSLRRGDDKRARDPVEVLMVEPLASESWSPHLIRGVLFYVLWTSAWTRGKRWPAFIRPPLELVAEGIDGLHYAELVDQLQSLWGPTRVRLPPGREVEPAPTTTLDIALSASRVVWWGGLAGMIFAAFSSRQPEPGGAALLAGVLAALGLMASRVLKARRDAALPRRGAGHSG